MNIVIAQRVWTTVNMRTKCVRMLLMRLAGFELTLVRCWAGRAEHVTRVQKYR